MAESYYDVLGVDPDASGQEISDAYRDRVLETHPDRNDDPDAAAQFKRVQTARSVLSDDAERARYDRLGHDSYVRFADRFSAVDDAASNDDESSMAESTGTETASNRRTSGSSAGTSTNTNTSDERGRGRSRGRSSHHARQRRRRQRATTGADRTRWFDGTTSTDAAGDGSEFDEATDSTARAGTDREYADDREAVDDREVADDRGFRYAVHDWDDPVDLEWDSRSIDHHTAVAVGCLTLLYPLFVYATLTSLFPLVVNVVVGACTVFLVGYLLTMPKLAMGTFGLWSLLVPLGAWRFATIDPFSAVGAVIVGAFWVPLGYAMGIWWALRP